MELNPTLALSSNWTNSTSTECGCNKAILQEAAPPIEPEVKLQFSVHVPKTQHIDTLVAIRDFLESINVKLSTFESYRY